MIITNNVPTPTEPHIPTEKVGVNDHVGGGYIMFCSTGWGYLKDATRVEKMFCNGIAVLCCICNGNLLSWPWDRSVPGGPSCLF